MKRGRGGRKGRGEWGRERRQRYRLRNHSTASKVGAKLLATACVCMCVFCVDAIAKKSNSETQSETYLELLPRS